MKGTDAEKYLTTALFTTDDYLLVRPAASCRARLDSELKQNDIYLVARTLPHSSGPIGHTSLPSERRYSRT